MDQRKLSSDHLIPTRNGSKAPQRGASGPSRVHRQFPLDRCNDTHGGGIYEWESRAAADAFYNDAWRERLRTVYGAVPQIEFFDVHAVVDNDAHTARIDA